MMKDERSHAHIEAISAHARGLYLLWLVWTVSRELLPSCGVKFRQPVEVPGSAVAAACGVLLYDFLLQWAVVRHEVYSQDGKAPPGYTESKSPLAFTRTVRHGLCLPSVRHACGNIR